MTFTEESLRAVGQLAGAVLGQQDLQSTLQEVTRIAALALPDCEGASLTAYSDGVPAVVAASDPWAQSLDELQYEEREGPCLDAARTGNVFRIRDLAHETRWPFYMPRALELGARSMASLPLASDGRIIGALNVYSRTPDVFDAEQVALAQIVAAQAGIAMQVAASFFRHRDLGEQMRQAMESRAVIEQAKGVLMRERRCTEPEAFDALVQLSQTSNRKLRDVAQALVDELTRPQ